MSPSRHIRPAYVVDDNEHVRSFLVDVLEYAGFEPTAFDDGQSFLAQLLDLPGGVVLLDIQMPGVSGLEVLAQLSEHADRFAPIMVTAHGDVAVAVQAMKRGARDFLQKPFDQGTLLEMVKREAAELETRWDSAVLVDGRLAELSTRERQVAVALSRGLSNKQVAQELNLSVRTVEMHRARAMQRLGCKSFAEFLSAILQAA